MAKDYRRYEGDINVIIPELYADNRALTTMSEIVKLVKKKDMLLHVLTSTGYNFSTDKMEDLTHAQLLEAIAGTLKVRLCVLGGVDIKPNSSCQPHAYSGTYFAVAYGVKDVSDK